jgi:hypothetical protein
MDPAVIVALITAGASLVTSVILAVWSAVARRRHDAELRRLDDRIDRRAKERDARRDYEYEARKRLYAEFEPLLLPLLEAAEAAQGTVLGFARTSSRGEILPDGTGWLSQPGYYHLSSVYRLLAPLAHILILKSRLTMVDIRLDPAIARRYLLFKCLSWSFTDDFDLAKSGPALEYRPHHADAPKRRPANPGVYLQQGIPVGILDSALHQLIRRAEGKDAVAQVLSFGEFERAFKAGELAGTAMEWITEAFLGFHPATRPVGWRILLAQYLLYQCILQGGRSPVDPGALDLPASTNGELDWRQSLGDADEDDAVGIPVRAARRYVEMRWSGFASLVDL